MRNIIKTFLVVGIPFGAIMGLYFSITTNILIGLVTGTICGVIFSLFINAFVYIQSKKFRKLEITDNKKVIIEGRANHIKGVESVGGWLWLTSEELIFVSHNINIQKHKIEIPLKQVKDIKSSLTFGIVPNGLQVITNNSTEKFVVNNRKEWVKRINLAILSE